MAGLVYIPLNKYTQYTALLYLDYKSVFKLVLYVTRKCCSQASLLHCLDIFIKQTTTIYKISGAAYMEVVSVLSTVKKISYSDNFYLCAITQNALFKNWGNCYDSKDVATCV